MIVSASILSADFARLGSEIESIDKAGTDWFHIDVMDGHFVPNITIGPMVLEAIKPLSKKPFDVHLMIQNPELYVDQFISAGADIITVHYESSIHLHRLISSIKEKDKLAGVSINPATPVNVLEEIINYVDMVLIMSVNPGFGGQKFIETSLNKISKLRDMIIERNLNTIIQVDGGVSDKNIHQLVSAGCSCAVAGSYIFKSPDYSEAIRKLKI